MVKRKRLFSIFFIVIAFVLVFYSLVFFLKDVPQKNKNYDYYSFLGSVNALENYFDNNYNIEYFPDALIKTPHTNFLTINMVVLKKITGVKLISMSYVFGISAIIFFFSSVYLFFNLFIKGRLNLLFAIISLTLLYPKNIINQNLGATLFSLGDIGLRAFSYQIFGLCLFFILFYLTFNYLIKNQKIFLPLIFLFLYVLFSIHLYIFFIFMTSLPFLIFYSRDFNDKTNIKKKIILIFISLLLVFALSLLWPFYNWINVVYSVFSNFSSSLIFSGSKEFSVNNPIYYLDFLSVGILCVIFLFKEKNKFLKYWLLFAIFIIALSLSHLGIPIPLFYRFIIFIEIILIAVFFNNVKFSSINKFLLLIAIFSIVAINFLNISKALDLEINRSDDYLLYKALYDLNINNSIILSDIFTSNLIQATNNKVFFIHEGHIAEGRLLLENNDRINKATDLIMHDITFYLKKEKVDYIVLDKTLKNSFLQENQIEHIPHSKIIYNNDKYEIIKIV